MAMMRLSLNALPKVEMTSTGSIPAISPVTIAEAVTTSIGLSFKREAGDDQHDAEQRPVIDHARPPKPAAAGRFDDEAVAGLHVGRRGRAQHLDRRRRRARPSCARAAASPPPIDPARRDRAAVGEDVGAHRLEEA